MRRLAGFGWKPQQPDHRDLVYAPPAGMRLPGKVEPLTRGITAYDQLKLGSCTGNGVARVLQYEQIKQGEPPLVPSRLFIYYGEREIEGTVDQDAGAVVRDGLKVIATQGAPPESLWPYSDANPGPFSQKPPAAVYAAAAQHEALQYRAITPGPGSPFRAAIASGLPIVFGFSVPASFEDGSWDPAADVLPLPGPNDGFIGGHCVVADGYDFTCRDFPEPFWWCANSWGPDWGSQGWFRMHFKFFDQLATDFWVVSRTT